MNKGRAQFRSQKIINKNESHLNKYCTVKEKRTKKGLSNQTKRLRKDGDKAQEDQWFVKMRVKMVSKV